MKHTDINMQNQTLDYQRIADIAKIQQYEYLYGSLNDKLIARNNLYGSKTFYHNDHLGSTTVLTDQSGNMIEKSAYEPYGEIKQGGTKSKYGYTGQEKDSETGLNYYDARYYDPHIQRFIQPDTLLPDIYDPQQLNRYAYARNNPLKYTDPSGHCIQPTIWGSIVGCGTAFLSLATRAVNFVSKLVKNPNTQQNIIKAEDKITKTVEKTNLNSLPKIEPPKVSTQGFDALVNKSTTNIGNVSNVGGVIDKSINIGSKIEKQMGARGWSTNLIKETVNNPSRTVSNLRDTRNIGNGLKIDDPATGFVSEDGSYVIINDVTKDVVQISNRLKPFWKAPWDK